MSQGSEVLPPTGPGVRAAAKAAGLPTPEDQTQLLRDFVIVGIATVFFALIFIGIWLAYEGASEEAQQVAKDGLYLMVGYFSTVIFYLGIRQGSNGNGHGNGSC